MPEFVWEINKAIPSFKKIYSEVMKLYQFFALHFFANSLVYIFFGVVSIAQLVEVTDSAVLGGVAEVVSSNPTEGHKNIFQHLPA